MNLWRNNQKGLSKILIIAIFAFLALVIGVIIWQIVKPKIQPPSKITLEVWGVWDESDDLKYMFSKFQSYHPYIAIKYTKFRSEEYEDALVRGWATDSGPDIYALPNSWIGKYKDDFITPLPNKTKIAYYVKEKVLGFKEETKIEIRSENSLTINDLANDFIDVISDDVVFDGEIYGLPLSIDTLAMYYNKNLLNVAHIVQPPATWAQFIEAVNKITLLDANDNIIRAGAALGTYENIPRAQDILLLLMMHNGAVLESGGKVGFDKPITEYGTTRFPGKLALEWYTDFSSPVKEIYTWNDSMPNALDAFADGQLAFFFGYKYHDDQIKEQATGLDYGVAPMPQVDVSYEVSYPNYWVYTVSQKTKNSDEAWNFIQLAASEKRVINYLNKTGYPSVRKNLLSAQIGDPEVSVFAQQALTAQSWYHGTQPVKTDEYIAEMITSVISGQSTIEDALSLTAKQIEQGL